MSEEALWDELLRVAKDHAGRTAPPPFEESYAAVARCLSICHRLGIEHPGMDLLGHTAFAPEELADFFRRTWRLATLHVEQRRVGQLEARRGVDADAQDLARLRAALADVRAMVLDFGWLPEPAKRRQLDRLEAVLSELQRARDDFDVSMGGVSDPLLARTIEIGRPNPVNSALGSLLALLGVRRAGAQAPSPATRALPAPVPARPDRKPHEGA